MFLPPPEVIGFFPEYRSTQTPWQELTPVAAWLIADLAPSRLVELGSYRGDSFFAFLQAAKEVPAVKDLVAVDSWEGDQHTGPFSSAVHQQFMTELADRADPRARAIQSYFSDAVAQFADGSIDLLHIDGAHDYASVKADFETWLPKMTADGVVLFHDTTVRTDDFGVWQLWAELERDYPGRTFNFTHSNGLGLLCLGTSQEGQIRKLCGLAPVEAAILKDTMRVAGGRVTALTIYENDLIRRNGGLADGEMIAETHVFLRGEARHSLETLFNQERLQNAGQLSRFFDARLEQLLRDQAGDVFTALRPMLAEEMRTERGRFLQEQAGDVFGALRPMLTEELEMQRGRLEDRQDRVSAEFADARVDQLLREQAGDVFSALRPMLTEEMEMQRGRIEDRQDRVALAVANARIEQLLGEQASDVFSALRPMLAEDLSAHQEKSRIKNDAQDDAIIGIGHKVEAHEAAVQELASYLRQVFQHPMFSGGRK